MKYYKNFLFSLRFTLQIQWATPLYFPAIWQRSLTFSSSIIFSHIQHVLLDRKCHDQIFVKMFFHYFFIVTKLSKYHLNNIISFIFTPVKNNWPAGLLSKQTSFKQNCKECDLDIFCIRTTCFFIAFITFLKYTQIQDKF